MKVAVLTTLVLLAASPASADACRDLRQAVAAYDVGATIEGTDVRLWNSVIRAARKLCKAGRRR